MELIAQGHQHKKSSDWRSSSGCAAIHRKAVPTESSYLPNSRVATECLQSGQLNLETHRAGAGGRVQRGKTTAGTYQAEDRSPGCTAYSALAEHDFRGSG